jgi:hypothetical protein
VKAALAFGRRYRSKEPDWAIRAYRAVLLVDPTNEVAAKYLERLGGAAPKPRPPTATGRKGFEPLITSDSLKGWSPGTTHPFTCSGLVMHVDCPSKGGKSNRVDIQLLGTYSYRGRYRMLEQRGEKISYGLLLGEKPNASACALVVDWDGYLSLIQWVERRCDTLCSKRLENLDRASWNLIEAELEPGKIHAKFNGQLIFTYESRDVNIFDGMPGVFLQAARYEVKDLEMKR